MGDLQIFWGSPPNTASWPAGEAPPPVAAPSCWGRLQARLQIHRVPAHPSKHQAACAAPTCPASCSVCPGKQVTHKVTARGSCTLAQQLLTWAGTGDAASKHSTQSPKQELSKAAVPLLSISRPSCQGGWLGKGRGREGMLKCFVFPP